MRCSTLPLISEYCLSCFSFGVFSNIVWASSNVFKSNVTFSKFFSQFSNLGQIQFLSELRFSSKNTSISCRSSSIDVCVQPFISYHLQVDFGQNTAGEQILTLTNPEGDIYCSSNGKLPYIAPFSTFSTRYWPPDSISSTHRKPAPRHPHGHRPLHVRERPHDRAQGARAHLQHRHLEQDQADAATAPCPRPSPLSSS